MSRNLENVLKSAQEGTYTQNPYKVREMSRIVEFDEKTVRRRESGLGRLETGVCPGCQPGGWRGSRIADPGQNEGSAGVSPRVRGRLLERLESACGGVS